MRYRRRHLRSAAKKRRALACLCALCFLISVSVLIARAVQADRARRIEGENRRIVAETVVSAGRATPAPVIAPSATPVAQEAYAQAAPTPAPTILPSAEKLRVKNSDLAGWLDVGGIDEIDFAVVQRDNTFYLTHDFLQGRNDNGAAFLDESCRIMPRDDNLLIYAHNMYDGGMFGKLGRLASLERIRLSPFTEFSTLYEKDIYLPVAVLRCSIDPKDKDYFAFSVNRFATEEAFNTYVARARALSAIALPFDTFLGDKLLTLVTCVKNDDARRLVVILWAMRADETVEQMRTLLG